MPPSISKPARTPRADRRASTRDALLDAAIASLIEVGYAATTTRGVSELAGVSQGAQQHHFPNKAALVDAAILRLTQQIVAQASAEPVRGANERERAEVLIDRLWQIHNLPISRAVFELFNVARTDTELAARITQTLAQGTSLIRAAFRSELPQLSVMPGFMDLLLVAMAMMRGTVVITAIPGAHSGYAPWSVVRRHILRDLDALVSAATAARN